MLCLEIHLYDEARDFMITMVPKPSNIHKTDLLIETDWLSRHLNDTDIRIVDLRSREEYDKGHIKNAVHLNFKDITGDEIVRREFPPENTPDICRYGNSARQTLFLPHNCNIYYKSFHSIKPKKIVHIII